MSFNSKKQNSLCLWKRYRAKDSSSATIVVVLPILNVHSYIGSQAFGSIHKNKLASLGATLVRNSAHPLNHLLTGVKCRATSVAKNTFEKTQWGKIKHVYYQCDYASFYASALRSHLTTHSGERRKKCSECDYASSL